MYRPGDKLDVTGLSEPQEKMAQLCLVLLRLAGYHHHLNFMNHHDRCRHNILLQNQKGAVEFGE